MHIIFTKHRGKRCAENICSLNIRICLQCRKHKETLALSLCWEYVLATHSSILAWRIPWTEETGGCTPWCYTELYMTERLTHPGIALKSVKYR